MTQMDKKETKTKNQSKSTVREPDSQKDASDKKVDADEEEPVFIS